MKSTTFRYASILLVLALLAAGTFTAGAQSPLVDVQILAFNDYHGNLEPPSGSSGRVGTINAGGVEYLATHLELLSAANPRNTVIVSAGDSIGASPLISALFHDEPTIEALNLMGVDFSTVGNHEFDEGWQELVRMQNGGCHPIDGCQDGDEFAGAAFKYLAANVIREDTSKPLFPAVKTRMFGGVKVAFIGVTLEGTPTIVTPSGVEGLDFRDEVETVNYWVPMLKSLGVEAIVVLLHEGSYQVSGADINACDGVGGTLVDIVNGFDPEVDVVITGHSHAAYNCLINGKVVTSAMSFGRVITDIDLTLDPATRDVVSATAHNVIVTRDVARHPLLTALLDKYRVLVAPLANRVIGTITADITRTANAAGESALGDVIADGQLFATQPVGFGEAVVAFMNSGGIRADLTYAGIYGSELPGEVTYGEMFAVQPFGNSMVTLTLTGAQIDTLLEQQFDNPAVGQMRILQVSQGFTYSWSQSAPTGSKVSDIFLNGVPIDPAASYRVTVNSFLADGGDNFFVLKDGTDRLGGEVDTDAFEKYFSVFSPVAPGPQNRITLLP